MTYVISDLHGYPLEGFIKLLEKADFGEDDFLYILGDVLDRNGDGGVELLRYIMSRDDMELLMGNHEAMLLSCAFVFSEITDESIGELSAVDLECFSRYCQNGGDVTLTALRQLGKQRPEVVTDILDYLRDAPLWATVSTENGDFVLVHSGFENFDKEKKLSSYSADDLLWSRPSLDTRYHEDIMTVLGHTPTMMYGEMYRGKILRTDTWIDIDTGAGFGEKAVLLRLDDMKEFRED